MARPLRLAVTMRDLELEHAGLAPPGPGNPVGRRRLGPQAGYGNTAQAGLLNVVVADGGFTSILSLGSGNIYAAGQCNYLKGGLRGQQKGGPSLGGGPPACGQAQPFLTSPVHARPGPAATAAAGACDHRAHGTRPAPGGYAQAR
jgi:hypothetical protein